MAVSKEPRAVSKGPMAVSKEPRAVSKGPLSVFKEPCAASKGPVSVFKGPCAVSRGPCSVLKGPSAVFKDRRRSAFVSIKLIYLKIDSLFPELYPEFVFANDQFFIFQFK